MTTELQEKINKIYQYQAMNLDSTSQAALAHYIALGSPTTANLISLKTDLSNAFNDLSSSQITTSGSVNALLQVVDTSYIGNTDISEVISGSDFDNILGAVGTTTIPTGFGNDAVTGRTSISKSLAATYNALGAVSFGNSGVSVNTLLGTTAFSGADITTAVAYLQTHGISAGSIVNADISASAAIAYSKLNLANNLQSSDIKNNAITNSKILDNTVRASKLYAEYNNMEDVNLKTYLGNTSIKTPTLSKAVGGGTLSYKFARDNNIYTVSTTNILTSLSAVCFNTNLYNDSTELAMAFMNAIGNDDPNIRIEDLAYRIDMSGTLRTVQQDLFTTVYFSSNTPYLMSYFITQTLGEFGTFTQVNLEFDITNALAIDPVSLTSAIGPFSLETTANTLTGGINEHEAKIVAAETCFATFEALGEDATMADVVTMAGCAKLALA